jgi:hypothetical protein
MTFICNFCVLRWYGNHFHVFIRGPLFSCAVWPLLFLLCHMYHHTTGTTALCEPWPSSGFLNNLIFTVWGQPHAQPLTWRTRVSLFIWLLPLGLPGLGGPTSSYSTTAIALRVSGALKRTTTIRWGCHMYVVCWIHIPQPWSWPCWLQPHKVHTLYTL